MPLTVGAKVTTAKYPGIWEVVETDEHMSRIKRDAQGVVFVATSSLVLHEAPEISNEEVLDAETLNTLALALARDVAVFAATEMGAKMEALNFTQSRLYRDILAQVIAHMTASGLDIVNIIADAMNLIGAEDSNQKLYDAAEKLR